MTTKEAAREILSVLEDWIDDPQVLRDMVSDLYERVDATGQVALLLREVRNQAVDNLCRTRDGR